MKRIKERILLMSSIDKLKLGVIAALLIATLSFGGYEIYKEVHKPDTIVTTKSELQSVISDTAWIREDKDGNTELLLFTQFMDVFDATITEDGKKLYNATTSYKILDFSHVEFFDVTGSSFDFRLIGKYELLIKDSNTIEFDGKEYVKDELTKNLNRVYSE